MAGDLNRATLIGRLGGDPEGKSMQGGGRVVNFSLATSESFTDLNPSRSNIAIANPSFARDARATSCARRSPSNVRFGNPVTTS